MKDVRLPQHGRDHRVGGSDPIPGLGDSGGGGIQFETKPQDGLWLYAESTSQRSGGEGIELYDSDVSSGHTGVFIHSDNNEVSITTGSQLAFSGASWLVQMGPVIFNFDGTWTCALNNDLDWTIDADVKWIFQHTAESFTIYNPSNQPIFRVKADGTFHIKTGGSWAADL